MTFGLSAACVQITQFLVWDDHVFIIWSYHRSLVILSSHLYCDCVELKANFSAGRPPPPPYNGSQKGINLALTYRQSTGTTAICLIFNKTSLLKHF